MLTDLPRWPRRRTATAVAVLLGTSLITGLPASAAEPGQAELSITGIVEQVVVDGDESGQTLDVRTFVRVDGVLVDLPDGVEVPGASGRAVSLEVVGDATLSRSETLEEIAVPEAGDAARVVAVEPLGAVTLSASAPAFVLGTHTLTVLPVYWSSPDGASVASLGGLASSTAQYWSEQSAGRIVIQPQVRDWAQIADPGTCDPSVLWSLALAAHGVSEPAARNDHVLVYFPRRADCAWAGLGSLSGTRIWVNGEPNADVFAHEFGHNLGLGHSGTATCGSGSSRVSLLVPVVDRCGVEEYGDRSDVMGIATSQPSGNLTSAFADYLGLATVARPSVGSSTTLGLAPLAQTTSLRSAALDVAGGTVYVDYRPATGRDTRMRTWAGVQVHLRTIDPVFGYPTAYLLDMTPSTSTAFTSPALATGKSWVPTGTSTDVTVVAVGATATIRVRPQATAQATTSAYVTRVYSDLFRRAPDPTGLATWTSALLAGTPRVAVANAITGSTEYRSGLIRASYLRYLGRSAEPAGLAWWLAAMGRGTTITDMETGFVASEEYYRRSGGDDSAWVRQLYRDVLGRSASGSEVSFWAVQTAMHGRGAVARGFLLSSEHLTTVVDVYYRQLLGRGIDPSGRASWVSAIQRGVRLEAIVGSIIASDEYWAGA